MKTNQKLAVMNWKCNPSTYSDAKFLAQASDKKNIVICPPAVFLNFFKKNLKKAMLGAQDGYWSEGAYTGEYSFNQLYSVGARYSIIGHSERRYIFKEGLQMINNKIKAALSAGISPIVCLGEKKRTTISASIKLILKEAEILLSDVYKKDIKKIIFAYEPVWAISSSDKSRNANIGEIEPVIIAIKNKIKDIYDEKVKVIYGGSVYSENIKDYLNNSFIDGTLIGSASVNKKKINDILKSL